jgi:hypothetical protein
VSVVCCQVEVSATGWSLVQRSPTDCGVSKKCVIVKPRNEEAQAPEKGLLSYRKKNTIIYDSACRNTDVPVFVCLFGSCDVVE